MNTESPGSIRGLQSPTPAKVSDFPQGNPDGIESAGFIVCDTGHQQWSSPTTPCTWCAVMRMRFVATPVAVANGRLVRRIEPISADEVMRLSWWRTGEAP